jgi:hypothetical protein
MTELQIFAKFSLDVFFKFCPSQFNPYRFATIDG